MDLQFNNNHIASLLPAADGDFELLMKALRYARRRNSTGFRVKPDDIKRAIEAIRSEEATEVERPQDVPEPA